jgi:hypothetical protein
MFPFDANIFRFVPFMCLRGLFAPNGVVRWREEGSTLSDKYYGHYFDPESGLSWYVLSFTIDANSKSSVYSNFERPVLCLRKLN